MTLNPTSLFHAWDRQTSKPLVGFVDAVLRGSGQVMFQNSPITGLLFFVGLFGGAWEYGTYAVLATAVATLTARWIGVDSGLIQAGLYGYNATLVGVGLTFYLDRDQILPVYVVLASITVVFVTAAIASHLGTWGVPALTAPFVVTTGLFLLAAYGFSELRPGPNSQAAALPAYPPESGRDSLSFTDVYEGLFNGVAEVFFQDKVWIGVLFLAAIFINSHIDCGMAIIGSAIGIAVAWTLGVSAESISLGLQGYNPVLTMMAIAGLFYVLQINSFILGIIAAAATVVVAAALSAIVAPFGSHVFTAPFVLTTWAFIGAKSVLQNVEGVAPADATTPEGNINVFRKGGHWWERRSADEFSATKS